MSNKASSLIPKQNFLYASILHENGSCTGFGVLLDAGPAEIREM